MKLYDAHLSPYSSACRMQVYAKGLDIDIVAVPEEITFEELKKISLIAKVPTLEDNGETVPESTVIAEYIEDLYPEVSLRAKGIRSRARMRLLSRIADLYILSPLSVLFEQVNPAQRDQVIVDNGIKNVHQGLDILESFIDSSGKYAVKNRLTLADCTLVPILFYVYNTLPFMGDTTPLSQWTKVDTYWQAIQNEENSSKIIGEMQIALAKWIKSNN